MSVVVIVGFFGEHIHVVPARGPVSYGGRSYEAYSFTGEAFPSGPLRLSLLLAS